MAENEDWATFNTAGAEAKEEQVEDWGDFGGFETAEPVTADSQASNTSGLISWATTFAAQTSSAEQQSVPPDLSQENQRAILPSETTVTLENLETVQNTPDSSFAVTDGLALKSDLDLEKPADFTSNQGNNQQADNSLLQTHIEQAQKAADEINDLEGKLSLAEQEQLKFKEEFEKLTRKHEELEDDSNTAQESLKNQKQKYTKLQEEHLQQLQGIRQAGHDALAVIVEEYKELSKQAVLEERERTQAELHNFLEEERRKFQELLTQQQESFKKSLTMEREKNDETVKAVLQEEQQKHKLAIKSSLSKERDEFKSVLEMAVKDTREQGKEAVKAAVGKEQDMHLALMEKMEKTLEEEREKNILSIKEALDAERQQSKIAIQEAMVEERTKSREATNKCFEENKSSMNDYIKEKQQMDLQAQQKQYLVMDLFLESARTQLKNLMEGNQKC